MSSRYHGDPAHAGLDEHELQVGVALEHAGEHPHAEGLGGA